MMTKDQQETVLKVYRRFVDADNAETQWTNIDEQMSMLEWIEDQQLVIEAAVLIQLQSQGEPRCNQNHPVSECFVPSIIESVGYILDMYAQTGHLHAKNKFILQYYLAMSQVGFIVY
ncbi:MAG: hypothetical protein HC840_00780 [Leptolyngbyaceae cyanobacterium RM2_2_4]|nr:hypothetical protein [Leptolyngbyaceae cyanobacterium RM2_2_4]